MAIEWIAWPVAPGDDPNPFEIDATAGSAYLHPELGRVVVPFHDERPAIFRARAGYVAAVRPGLAVFARVNWSFPYALSAYDDHDNVIGQREVDPIEIPELDMAAVLLDFSLGYELGRIELSLLAPDYYHNTVTSQGVTLEDVYLHLGDLSPVLFDAWYNLDGQDPRAPFWTNYVKTKEARA